MLGGRSTATVRRWIREGMLGAVRTKRRLRIPQTELEDFVANMFPDGPIYKKTAANLVNNMALCEKLGIPREHRADFVYPDTKH
jgi:excisionase family DNA binding protein